MIEAILNRWRGTGTIFSTLPFLKGTHIYAIYLAAIIGLFSTWYYGFIAGLLFIIGESFGWGKWVGYLTSNTQKEDYNDLEGRGFPFIHNTAEAIVKEQVNYRRYCEVALVIRGFWWWAPLYLFLAGISLTSYSNAIISIFVLSIMFPIACYLGKLPRININNKWLQLTNSWEWQELIYGAIHGMVFWITIT